jgi:hypothetical protein
LGHRRCQGDRRDMNLKEWGNRGFDAFKETANLVGLTVLIVASYLTGDPLLLGIGMAAEGLYLLVYMRWASTPYGHGAPPESQGESDDGGVVFLDYVLLVVTVAGFVVILFFGFGKHLLSHRWPYLTHAEGWEAGAIGWTWGFLFYYLAKYREVRNRAVNTFIIATLMLISAKLLTGAWESMREPITHVWYITGIGMCFLLTDALAMLFHKNPKEQERSRNSLYWADIPMVLALVVLLVYLYVHPDAENRDVFVSGVVSCQLLISNAVFIVMEFGLLRPAKESISGA